MPAESATRLSHDTIVPFYQHRERAAGLSWWKHLVWHSQNRFITRGRFVLQSTNQGVRLPVNEIDFAKELM